MDDSRQITKLLWTGGWDSTFRLMQLLIEEKKKVQPYYLKFPTKKSTKMDLPVRRSTEKEIMVMEKIRERLFNDYTFTKKLLKPLIVVDALTIEPDEEITQAYEEIIKKRYIGNQYDWLARFAKQNGIDSLEMGIEIDGNTNAVIKPYVKKIANLYFLDDKYSSYAEHKLFKYFSFPILEYSKEEMAEISVKKDWIGLMKMTWFCHRPYFGKFPCGSCNPCINAFEDGMEWRIPFLFRILGRPIKKIYNSKLVRVLR